ncbi:unnamed protein product [Brachionus calyciflorus]|uniref:Uncharacterized protein n=1 Tax=Brachionus calyciflorus TaxID=104777 RepID=A0A813UVS2_9BILA|nr:unnamed protein product [Brachionus calyciflorus]
MILADFISGLLILVNISYSSAHLSVSQNDIILLDLKKNDLISNIEQIFRLYSKNMAPVERLIKKLKENSDEKEIDLIDDDNDYHDDSKEEDNDLVLQYVHEINLLQKVLMNSKLNDTESILNILKNMKIFTKMLELLNIKEINSIELREVLNAFIDFRQSLFNLLEWTKKIFYNNDQNRAVMKNILRKLDHKRLYIMEKVQNIIHEVLED